jgi:outer membrane protein TolC
LILKKPTPMKRKILYILISACLFPAAVSAQLTLEHCQEKARANYPLIKKAALIEQTASYNLENAAKAHLPQISFSAKATYQTAVTEIPISLPNLSIEGLSKDQYQAVAEVSQVIWDGGAVKAQQEITKANAEAEKQKLESDLYALRERVNQLFFGILLIDEQLKQNDLLQNELQTNFDKITAYMNNGVANQADVDAIKVEQLNALQHRTELNAARKAYCDVLSAFTGEDITEQTSLLEPALSAPADLNLNNRPENSMFESQLSLFDSQTKLINSRNMPKIGAFVQGGYGKPGLNMLKNEFAPFAIGGIRFNWNFGGFYTSKNDLQLIEVNKLNVAVQKETFLFNTGLQATQQFAEIEKYQNLISNDNEIIQLRNNIKKSAEAKVANGTLSVSDLIREINAENMAQQNKALHEIQYLISIYNLKNTTNR